ncbi:bifunctional DNA primase/polymerase [Nocardioides sp. CFH 31398]|nr:bifunctional DNA primase/polymerase [Nocardioides sp. CFH 31398]
MPLGVGENQPHSDLLGSGYGYAFDSDDRWFVGSRNPGLINSWWSSAPAANIGVVTGRPNRLLVVDMDASDVRSVRPGAQWLTAWEADHGLLPDGPLARTPSGGWHLWLRYEGDDYFPTRINWLPNVDVKVDGGFVAVPPSMRMRQFLSPVGGVAAEFTTYDWVRPLPSNLNAVPAAPEWLLADVLSRPRSIYQLDGSSSPGGSGPLTVESFLSRGGFGWRTGSRDCDCMAFARVLFNDYAGDSSAVTEAVRQVWQITPQGDDPFAWRQAEKCIRSAHTYWKGSRS